MTPKARGVVMGTSGCFAGLFTFQVLLPDWSLSSRVIALILVSVSVSVIVLKITERFQKES